jgi:hypothetical protein
MSKMNEFPRNGFISLDQNELLLTNGGVNGFYIASGVCLVAAGVVTAIAATPAAIAVGVIIAIGGIAVIASAF